MSSSILLIGSGRLATHLAHWQSLQSHKLDLHTWNRQQPIRELHAFLERQPLVWLAISDSALTMFFEEHLARYNLKVVHFSGALHDPRMFSAHPLMSFTKKLFTDSFYQSIHFVITGVDRLDTAMPGFKNSFSVIPANQKAFYHALCVMAGNFPQLLWNEIFKEAANLKIPAVAFETYLKTITQNFIEQKGDALTGPIVRNDSITIQKNIEALEQNQKLQATYKTFAEEFTP